MPEIPSGEGSVAEAVGKVFLVDDDPAVRRSLARLLRISGFEVLSFATAQNLLAVLTADSGPGCVVADLRMPRLSGLDLQAELHRRGLDLPIVFISGRADVKSSVLAMKGGAVDFLEKPVDAAMLGNAIRGALERDARRRAERAVRAELEGRAKSLTPREREVFALVVNGLLNKQVGAELGATEETIKVHRARIMEKMQAGSLAELVRMADQLGLGPPAARAGSHMPLPS